MADTPTLDLSGAPERPVVKLPSGDFEMLMPEELTFDQFAAQITLGNEIQDKAAQAADPQVLTELQQLVVRGAKLILVDIDDESARAITPGMYLKISTFFKQLGEAIAVEPTSPSDENGSTSAAGSDDSTVTD